MQEVNPKKCSAVTARRRNVMPVRVFWALLPGVIAFSVTACSVSGIEKTPEDIETPAGWARGGEAGDAGEVDTDWLASFADPRLDKLVTESIAGNFALEQERQRLNAARQAVVGKDRFIQGAPVGTVLDAGLDLLGLIQRNAA